MNRILTTITATFAAGAAAAGTVIYEAPAEMVIPEPAMGGSGSWLIPLAIIAILALTLTSRDRM